MTTLLIPDLADGEIYFGFYGTARGEACHVILLPGDNSNARWQEQMDWAKSIGGDLPNLIEHAMLKAYSPEQFQPFAYWSNQTHIGHVAYAWCQYFGQGTQDYCRKLIGLRARAVRRVTIERSAA